MHVAMRGTSLKECALIGHTILFEAFSESAIEGFAALARRETSPHLLMGEHNAVQRFWNYYAIEGSVTAARLSGTFPAAREPFANQDEVPGLRPHTRRSGARRPRSSGDGIRNQWRRSVEKRSDQDFANVTCVASTRIVCGC